MSDRFAFSDGEMKVLMPIFQASGREYLRVMEKTLSELHEFGVDALPGEESLAGLHRAAHSLKGAALQMGFLHIGGLARAMEQVILAVKECGIPCAASWIDPLTRAARNLDVHLQSVDRGTESPAPDGDLVQELEGLATEIAASAESQGKASSA